MTINPESVKNVGDKICVLHALNIGTRCLHMVMERLLENISFAASDYVGDPVVINADYVDQHLDTLAKDQDLRVMAGEATMGYSKHFRVCHGQNEFSKGQGVHINGIESFWSFTKRWLAKFNGVKPYFH